MNTPHYVNNSSSASSRVGRHTAIWTAVGLLYLAAVLDIFSRMVVNWAMYAYLYEALVYLADWFEVLLA